MSRILLITPPFTQLNTPYPATPFLKGFLNTIGRDSFQMDLGIEVINNIFSKKGLQQAFDYAVSNNQITTDNAKRIIALRDNYVETIGAVMSFLQQKNTSLARQIVAGSFLPKASRFDLAESMETAFGPMGITDMSKYMATLYLEDLSDFLVECVDPNFGFSRYAESLGRSANSFSNLYNVLMGEPAYVDKIMFEILGESISKLNPALVCFSVPFPGNLYSAFRCAQFLKQNDPNVKIAMGGGFPNTELRSLTDVRVFEFFDFITLDDGERPLELLIENVFNPVGKQRGFMRTFILNNNVVEYVNNTEDPDYRQRELPAPDYSDLLLDKYISVIEIPNPMHALWSNGRWNKLTMAHGCYWGKCAFCDVSLHYIKHYDPLAAAMLVDRIEEVISQTGETGFHFVDEAAPPKLMIEMAIEILRRRLIVTWWTNVRFERSFTPGVCALLKESGCIAVAGGLEVASDRLLKLINKGVTVEQVAKVTRNFTGAGIMVHAYLMYGFPSQTEQETIDSLEMVRQMFELGILQSGFWHRFALTTHSPVGKYPEKYGIKTKKNKISFADNDVQFFDNTGIDHEQFSFGLRKSLFNYMHGICFDHPLQNWFNFRVPKTKISSSYIKSILDTDELFDLKAEAKVFWLGPMPEKKIVVKTKKGKTYKNMQLTIHIKLRVVYVNLDEGYGEWLIKMLPLLSIKNAEVNTVEMLKTDFEKHFENFKMFWFSKPLKVLKKNGLLVI
jgi:hypothetical protein